MAFIETITDADPDVPNSTRLFAHRPAVYEAWQELLGAIKANMDPRRYELATIAAARRLRSSYCMLAHTSVMIDALDFEPDAILNIIADHRAAHLDDAEIAIMDLAEQVVTDATSVTQADVDRLRAHGLTDTEILDVILAAAARCFFSKTLDAAGVQPDAHYQEVEPRLRDALSVGRPIEQAARP